MLCPYISVGEIAAAVSRSKELLPYLPIPLQKKDLFGSGSPMNGCHHAGGAGADDGDLIFPVHKACTPVICHQSSRIFFAIFTRR